MRTKQEKTKKAKKQIKVQDLKPAKDAKGGGHHLSTGDGGLIQHGQH